MPESPGNTNDNTTIVGLWWTTVLAVLIASAGFIKFADTYSWSSAILMGLGAGCAVFALGISLGYMKGRSSANESPAAEAPESEAAEGESSEEE
jgi:hypothetical protein